MQMCERERESEGVKLREKEKPPGLGERERRVGADERSFERGRESKRDVGGHLCWYGFAEPEFESLGFASV